MERVAVIGLGYVGLPVAIAFARHFQHVVGFDVNEARVAALNAGHDRTGEVPDAELQRSTLKITADPADLRDCTFFVVAVPTPIDSHHRPDLTPVERASETVGRAIQPGAVVVYESTVYPGVTEDICRPILARVSGLVPGVDFKVGYSPERINPGDTVHRLETIVKVVSGEDPETLERVAVAYQAILDVPVHRAPTIKVAEAAKVIENTQRDINIALMNELALIFERLDIRTTDVLAAAGTKWNFLPFTPGLVGGHCIGVDPYYLTARAEEVGYHPQVILAGRRINDDMGRYVANRVLKRLSRAGVPGSAARIGVLGLTFKENVADCRNSRVPDIIAELESFGVTVLAFDPMITVEEARHELGVALTPLDELRDLDALLLTVAHRDTLAEGAESLASRVREGGVFFDVKSAFSPAALPSTLAYESL
ncbi:MAG: nucleotide sugar dehydrogenase [Alphaproteobacteria bacterium]|nr:nucleotide sugar dehydrogenase [Alphaproteobacteria bacterium]